MPLEPHQGELRFINGSQEGSPMRAASFGLAVIVAGCAAVQAPAPPIWDGTEECFVRLMEPIRLRMKNKDFNHTYRDVLLGSEPVPLQGSKPGTLGFLKSKGGFCGTLRRGGGVTGPQGLEVYSTAAKVVMFDSLGIPRFQIAHRDRFAVLDADGDPSTLELVRWSERCEGSQPPYLVIHRLDDLTAAPMLALNLNPEAGRESSVIESWYEPTPDGGGRGGATIRKKHIPDRNGRWKFERNANGRNDVLIEEHVEGEFKTVARFVLNANGSAWQGPSGGDADFWIKHDDAWVEASFVRFSELPQDRWFRGSNFGEIRDDVDHLKAAKEAARDAGLTK